LFTTVLVSSRTALRSENHCNILPADGILEGLPEVGVDDFDVVDDGPTPHEEDDDDLPFLEEHTSTA
jgi:hypothetical protein